MNMSSASGLFWVENLFRKFFAPNLRLKEFESHLDLSFGGVLNSQGEPLFISNSKSNSLFIDSVYPLDLPGTKDLWK